MSKITSKVRDFNLYIFKHLSQILFHHSSLRAGKHEKWFVPPASRRPKQKIQHGAASGTLALQTANMPSSNKADVHQHSTAEFSSADIIRPINEADFFPNTI